MAIRITHAVRKIIRDGDPDARITHAVRKVIRDGDPDVRITHAVRKVIRNVEIEITSQTSSMFLVFP